MKNKRTNNMTKVIIMFYKGKLTEGQAKFKEAIICSTFRQAALYLLQNGYIREDYLPKKKRRKDIPEDENARFYVNTKKSSIAGIIENVEYIG